jgi:hypothetical protein
MSFETNGVSRIVISTRGRVEPMTETTVTFTPTPKLPGQHDAGDMGEWPLPVSDIGEELVVTGRFLGMGSSARNTHSNHNSNFAPPGVRCRACRWFEARIFRIGEDADGDYIVYNVRQSIVPGETPRYSVRRWATASEVVDMLTSRRNDDGSSSSSISLPAQIVLSQAALHDVGIREAYVNRALA